MNGAPWWAVIAARLVGAVIALAGTLLSGWRQYRQSRREEWFRRVQWAAAMANQTGTKVSASGLSVLEALAKSKLANSDDLVRRIDRPLRTSP